MFEQGEQHRLHRLLVAGVAQHERDVGGEVECGADLLGVLVAVDADADAYLVMSSSVRSGAVSLIAPTRVVLPTAVARARAVRR